jgi:hypothetical protein
VRAWLRDWGPPIAFVLVAIGLIAVQRFSYSIQPSIYYQYPKQKEESAYQSSFEKRENPDEALARYTFWLVLFTGVLAIATIGLGIATYGLYRAGERQIKIADKAAEAALLNAKAIMAAEGAVIYPIITYDNLEMGIASQTIGTRTEMWGPFVHYCLKNFGKTPATLELVMHGMHYFEVPATDRTMYQEDSRPLTRSDLTASRALNSPGCVSK